MKKETALVLIAAMCISTVMAFRLTYDKCVTVRTTQTEQGTMVFYRCCPVRCDTVGKFDVKQRWTGEPKEQLQTALKTLAERYPKCNGILFADDNMKEAFAIRVQL